MLPDPLVSVQTKTPNLTEIRYTRAQTCDYVPTIQGTKKPKLLPLRQEQLFHNVCLFRKKKTQRGKRYNIILMQHQLKELPPKAGINFCNTDSYYFAKDE